MLVEFLKPRGVFGVGSRTDQMNDGVCDLLIRQGYCREVIEPPASPPAVTTATVTAEPQTGAVDPVPPVTRSDSEKDEKPAAGRIRRRV